MEIEAELSIQLERAATRVLMRLETRKVKRENTRRRRTQSKMWLVGLFQNLHKDARRDSLVAPKASRLPAPSAESILGSPTEDESAILIQTAARKRRAMRKKAQAKAEEVARRESQAAGANEAPAPTPFGFISGLLTPNQSAPPRDAAAPAAAEPPRPSASSQAKRATDFDLEAAAVAPAPGVAAAAAKAQEGPDYAPNYMRPKAPVATAFFTGFSDGFFEPDATCTAPRLASMILLTAGLWALSFSTISYWGPSSFGRLADAAVSTLLTLLAVAGVMHGFRRMLRAQARRLLEQSLDDKPVGLAAKQEEAEVVRV